MRRRMFYSAVIAEMQSNPHFFERFLSRAEGS